ncbi:YndJ family protein [Actinomadura hibisca]|uniref:YndJ family protein n=1 Tax=Actinomadura hibisca TaxID=68565 RepID=UPI000AE8AC11|nr:YndJ family protein [Actinomadura hibisca]
MVALVHVIVMTGMLVVVPLGLRLVGLPAALRGVWLAGAAAGSVSLWLPRGAPAVALAALYAAATLPLAGQAVRRLRRWDPVEIAVATALAAPAVAGTALVAERGGVELFGFSLTILSLTVAHFHYAGFAAALIAGLVGRAAAARPQHRRAATAAALSVPAGTLLVLAGYFAGQWAEFAGAVVLTCGMWLTGWLTWRSVRSGGAVRVLLLVSSAVLAATMVLALSWALGEASGLPHPSLSWMVATHGVGNAFGFALCGILAWACLKEEAL